LHFHSDEESADVIAAEFSVDMMDRCIVVGFVDRWYPGFITQVVSADVAKVNFLHPAGSSSQSCTFQWPKSKDEMEVSIKAVVSFDVDVVPYGSSLRLWKMTNVKKINKLFNC
jgi:hypothetical protein